MKGHRIEASLLPILQKKLSINGFVLRSQSLQEKTYFWDRAHMIWHNLFLNRRIKPIIDSTFRFDEVELAHQRMRSSEHFGKIIVSLPVD